MTKIKNTKKGMAKKTLSMSLVVAMLATSNVPVWAAEFSDGTDAAAFTSEAEAPVVDDTTDVVVDNAQNVDTTATISVNGATSNKISAKAAETMTVTTNWNVSNGAEACINVFAPKDGTTGTVNVDDENETVKQSFNEGYSDIKRSGSLNGTTVNWRGINPADYIGKKVYVAVTEKGANATDVWKVKAVTAVTITGNKNQDYVKTSFSKTEGWGTTLDSLVSASDYALVNGATVSSTKWYDPSGNEVKGTYTTTKDDINKVYTLKAVLNGALDNSEVTLGTVTITTKVPTSTDILSVVWDCATDAAGNPTFTYDGTAHYPKLRTISLKDGSVIDAASATTEITYTQLTVDQATNANEGSPVSYIATVNTAEYGTLTITKNLVINKADLTTDGTLAVSKGFEFNSNDSYAVSTEADATKAGLSVSTKAGKALTIGTDYSVTVTAAPNKVGSENALVTVNGAGNYKGTLVLKTAINAYTLKEDDASFKAGEVPSTGITFDGNAKTPEVEVKVNSTTLKKNTDYTVEYSANTQVGTATVTITGKGNYAGTVTKTFKIVAATLAPLKTLIENDFKDASKTTYTGKAIDLVKDAYDGLKYVKNRDFTVEYEPQNVNAGKVLVKINGIGNYKDAKESFEFTIGKRAISDSAVKVAVQGLTYSSDMTDKQIKDAVSLTYNGMTLVENTDYKISNIVKNGKNITLTIVGMDGNYTGTRIETVSVAAKDINTLTLPKIDAQKYTGSEIKVVSGKVGDSKFEIKDGNYTLELNKDYKIVNYENNKNVGTATINIVGTGAYTGKASISFPIVAAELNGSIVYRGTTGDTPVIPDQAYSYAKVTSDKGYTFDFADTPTAGKLTVIDKDGKVVPTSKYTVSYKDNTAAGTATITVEGKAGYSLNAVNTFKIVPAKLSTLVDSSATFAVETKDYYYTGEAIEPSVDVVLKDGSYKLVKDTDYKLTYSDNVNAGTNTGKVTLVGLGNYAGIEAETDINTKLTKNFTIQKTTIRATDIVAKDVAYLGGLPVTPDVTITNQNSGKALVEGTDYTVEIKDGGTAVGQVKAVIKLSDAAKKNYTLVDSTNGEYNITFNVTAKNLADVTVNAIEDQIATGEQIKPAITVMNGSVKLVEGTDYEVTYGDNKEAGEGTVTIKALTSSKNYTGSQTVKFNIVEKAAEVGQAMIADVKVSGNTVTPILSGDVDGAVGYDYVLATEENVTDGRVDISKNILSTHTNFYYVPEGTYYVYCHAWKRGEDGKKVFGEWSNIKEVKVEAKTPSTPTVVSAKVKGNTVTVTYTESEDATGYDIVLGTCVKKVNGERRPVEYGKLVKKNVEAGTVTVTFTNVPAGTYYAGLHAYNRTSKDGSKVFSKWSPKTKTAVVK